MSSIATRTRTSSGSSDPMRVTMRQIALVTATVIFCILLISFRPFSMPVAPDGPQAGDTVNQLGFGLVGAIALAALAMFADPRKLMRLVSLGWLLMFGLLLASAFRKSRSGNCHSRGHADTDRCSGNCCSTRSATRC